MLELRPISEAIGTEVRGVDITQPLSGTDFDKIYQAFLDTSLLLFRDQALTPDQQVAFTRQFGEIVAYYDPSERAVPGHPEILLLTNLTEEGKPSGKHSSAYGWHIDGHYLEKAPMATVLHAVECPPSGGDTWFANTHAAYESLPQETKRLIDGKQIIISRVQARPYVFPDKPPVTPEQRLAWPDMPQPIARTHPITKRKALYVASIVPWRIPGIPEEQSAPLIGELQATCIRPEFVYCHKWRQGDTLLWDNISSMHRATPYDVTNDQRRMHRTTVAGDVAF